MKFDVVAHSMGGRLLRYYLMYGGEPLAEDGSLPELNWAGARRVENAVIVATPSAGSERVGGAWMPRLATPIPWTSVTFVYGDHLELTSDPAFTDDVLYRLLEAPRGDVTGLSYASEPHPPGSLANLGPRAWPLNPWPRRERTEAVRLRLRESPWLRRRC